MVYRYFLPGKSLQSIPVAEPAGGANPRGGDPTYDFAKFSQKLNEIEERVWTPRGGGRVSHASLRPATKYCYGHRDSTTSSNKLPLHKILHM